MKKYKIYEAELIQPACPYCGSLSLLHNGHLITNIRCICQTWNQEVQIFLIIDSFPVPVCQPIRNYRVKIFRGIADIGYKATKKIYYYGFKVHALVSDDGYVLDYTVTRASVHDAKETVELMINAHPINHYLLGDEGYLGKDLEIGRASCRERV